MITRATNGYPEWLTDSAGGAEAQILTRSDIKQLRTWWNLAKTSDQGVNS
jgi:hypothetical protein